MKAGWQLRKIGDIAQHSLGKMLDKAKNKGVPRPYLRNINVRWFDFNLSNLLEMRFLPEEAAKYLVTKGDLVICEGGYPGRAAIWDRDDPVYFQKALHRVRFNEPQHSKWFLYYLYFLDLTGNMRAHCRGAGIQHFTAEALSQFELPLAPLPDQQRIVPILDEAFAAIATAKANTEKNLQNARALFESQLDSIFNRADTGHTQTTLGAEVDILAGFAFKSASYTTADSSVKLLRGDNIVQGSLRWEDVKRWPDSDTSEYSRYQLCDGDVVLAMDRPWIKAGLKHAMISKHDLPCLLVQRTARLRARANLENRFLMLLLRSAEFTRHILGVQTGIGVPHISGQQIQDFAFLKPSLGDQRLIADKFDELKKATELLASTYSKKTAALEKLKESLLHHAFTGNL